MNEIVSMNREKRLIKIIQEVFPESKDFIGDDAALVKFNSPDLVFALDNLIESVHYDADLFSPYDIGWKALAVNISDLAAMASKPLYFLVGLAIAESTLPKSIEDWVREFYSGIYDCAKAYGFPKLIGGDITKAIVKTAISITVIGEARSGNQFLRSSARSGDKLCVTGKFGNSGFFLKEYLQSKKINSDKDYQLRPKPRLEEALKIKAHRGALMDTSDGLAQALLEIAEQSKVDLIFDSGLIPKDSHIALQEALYGGEDYELLGSFAEVPEGFIQIGEVKDFSQKPMVMDLATNKALSFTGLYEHF